MGLRCSRAFSFARCANLIVASLEYSYGSLHQAKGRVWRVTSLGGWQPDGPRKVRVWCVLHQGTVEETMFEVVATKEDAPTICLLGRRVPRTFKTVDMEEILALPYSRLRNWKSEAECETQWPTMRDAVRATQRVPAWMRRMVHQSEMATDASAHSPRKLGRPPTRSGSRNRPSVITRRRLTMPTRNTPR